MTPNDWQRMRERERKMRNLCSCFTRCQLYCKHRISFNVLIADRGRSEWVNWDSKGLFCELLMKFLFIIFMFFFRFRWESNNYFSFIKRQYSKICYAVIIRNQIERFCWVVQFFPNHHKLRFRVIFIRLEKIS